MKLEVDTTAFRKAMDDLIARHDETMRRGLLDMSNKLLKEARLRTPKLSGNLEESIRNDVIEDRGRISARVYIPENAKIKVGKTGFNYAIWIHEGEYMLGEKSLDKQAKGTVLVGPRYLARAVEENKAVWLRMIAFYVKKACKG